MRRFASLTVAGVSELRRTSGGVPFGEDPRRPRQLQRPTFARLSVGYRRAVCLTTSRDWSASAFGRLQRATIGFLWLPSTKKKPAENDGHKQQAQSHRKRADGTQNRRGNRRPKRGNPTQTKQPKRANHRKPENGTDGSDDGETERHQRRAARRRHKNRAADERDAKPTRRKHGTRPNQQPNNETTTTADDSGTPAETERSGNGERPQTNADGDAGRRTATTNTSTTKEQNNGTPQPTNSTGQPLHCAGAHRRKGPPTPAKRHNYLFSQRPCL